MLVIFRRLVRQLFAARPGESRVIHGAMGHWPRVHQPKKLNKKPGNSRAWMAGRDPISDHGVLSSGHCGERLLVAVCTEGLGPPAESHVTMLAYLDSLCAALLARDSTEIQRLLSLPASRDLPLRVREEAVTISRAGGRGFMAPINALHFYYKLTHLVDETADPVFGASNDSAHGSEGQLDLPLRKVGAR